MKSKLNGPVLSLNLIVVLNMKLDLSSSYLFLNKSAAVRQSTSADYFQALIWDERNLLGGETRCLGGQDGVPHSPCYSTRSTSGETCPELPCTT